MNIPIKINTCVIYKKFVLDKTLKSVQPIKDCILMIDNNINNDPKNVYRKK
jgi:hypothetical protein